MNRTKSTKEKQVNVRIDAVSDRNSGTKADEIYKSVLSGKQKGIAMRRNLHLDKLEKSNNKIKVIIDKRIKIICAPYFAGLFGYSIAKMGEKGFREMYDFECSISSKISVENGIRYILLNQGNRGGKSEKQNKSICSRINSY